jgi:hypothetical protein
MKAAYLRVFIVWVVTLVALYIFQAAYGMP